MQIDSAYIIQAIAFIFYTGVLTQKVWSHDKRHDKTEAEIEEIRRDLYSKEGHRR